MTILLIVLAIFIIVFSIIMYIEIKNAPIWDEDIKKWITEEEFKQRYKK